jgi:uncharacterized protein YjiS (DUF1127 family)
MNNTDRSFLPAAIGRPADILEPQAGFARRVLGGPWQLLQAPVQALNRRFAAAREEAELAALDDHLLHDLGLKRSLIDHTPCVRVDAAPCLGIG